MGSGQFGAGSLFPSSGRDANDPFGYPYPGPALSGSRDGSRPSSAQPNSASNTPRLAGFSGDLPMRAPAVGATAWAVERGTPSSTPRNAEADSGAMDYASPFAVDAEHNTSSADISSRSDYAPAPLGDVKRPIAHNIASSAPGLPTVDERLPSSARSTGSSSGSRGDMSGRRAAPAPSSLGTAGGTSPAGRGSPRLGVAVEQRERSVDPTAAKSSRWGLPPAAASLDAATQPSSFTTPVSMHSSPGAAVDVDSITVGSGSTRGNSGRTSTAEPGKQASGVSTSSSGGRQRSDIGDEPELV